MAWTRLGRRFTGIERDAGFFRTATGRIENAYGSKPANPDELIRNLGLRRIA